VGNSIGRDLVWTSSFERTTVFRRFSVAETKYAALYPAAGKERSRRPSMSNLFKNRSHSNACLPKRVQPYGQTLDNAGSETGENDHIDWRRDPWARTFEEAPPTHWGVLGICCRAKGPERGMNAKLTVARSSELAQSAVVQCPPRPRNMRECMFAHGGRSDHIIPIASARSLSYNPL